MKYIVRLLAIFITLACGAVAQAQQTKKVPRIGYLGAYSPSAGALLLEAFRQGLRDLGYVEGQNIFIDYRWAEGNPDRLPTLAEGMAGKWVELLTEAVPKVSRVSILAVAQTPAHRTSWMELQAAAQALQVELQRQEIAGPSEIEYAFASLIKGHSQGLVVLPHAVPLAHRTHIVGLAEKNRLPAIYPDRQFVESGGLMSYGTNFSDLHRRAAIYVDKILKGAKPADLPVEQPKKFELVMNLKAAKQIGLTIPPNVLARADKVIR